MPDQVVILLMFAVLTSFGIVWFANELRLRYPARYQEHNFYFILSSICYGLINWIVPFVILKLMNETGETDPTWFVAMFIPIGVPILLVKLFFLYQLFQELLSRQRPAWFNRVSLVSSLAVILATVWFIKSYYDGADLEQLQGFIVSLGLIAVTIEFTIIIHYLIVASRMKTRVIGDYSMPFGWVFLGGYSTYVLFAYSAFLLPQSPLLELTPYLYFIIHGLPLLVLWLFHQNEPAPVLKTDTPAISQFIEENALTVKEAQILKQLIRGSSNREIAEQLHISPHTVRNHIYNIYNKTGIRNRFQLLAICQVDENSLVD